MMVSVSLKKFQRANEAESESGNLASRLDFGAFEIPKITSETGASNVAFTFVPDCTLS